MEVQLNYLPKHVQEKLEFSCPTVKSDGMCRVVEYASHTEYTRKGKAENGYTLFIMFCDKNRKSE